MLTGLLHVTPVYAEGTDPRIREIWYDEQQVVTVPVRRGVVTHIMLDSDEAIAEMGSGLGADCTKAESAWCIAAQPGGRSIFIKPKSGATVPTNLAVVTDRRTHAFRFVVLPDHDARQPIYRLLIKAPLQKIARSVPTIDSSSSVARRVPVPSPEELVASRLTASPQVLNTSYSIAEGKDSSDIVPTLAFDDGRFTYFRFPNNREVPAVFQVLADGSEALANVRMEDDLLVVDRVSRRLMLRAGSAVIGVWNDAFDLDGVPPAHGTTVPGVERVLRDGARQRTVAKRPLASGATP
jgi:type IV secretion system protein VirB9